MIKRNRLGNAAKKVFSGRFTQLKQLRSRTFKNRTIISLAKSASFVVKEYWMLDLAIIEAEVQIILLLLNILNVNIRTEGLVLLTLERMSRLAIGIIMLQTRSFTDDLFLSVNLFDKLGLLFRPRLILFSDIAKRIFFWFEGAVSCRYDRVCLVVASFRC